MPSVRNLPGRERLRQFAVRLALEAEGARIPRSAPLSDTRIDAVVGSLPAFDEMAAILRRSTTFRRLYGPDFAERWTLAWTYGAVGASDRDGALDSFWDVLTDPEWHQIWIANLSHFRADADALQFPDGLQIRTRSRPELLELTGWSEDELQGTLGEDWMRRTGATGDYVMLSVDSRLKDPDQPLGSIDFGSGSMERLLLALRLHRAGDVSLGPVFVGRVDRGFSLTPMNIGSSLHSGANHSFGGQEYALIGDDVPTVADQYQRLAVFQERHSARLSNIATALDRFRSTYDRSFAGGGDRLIDDMIAMEALLGTTGPELTYTMAAHGSGLLAEHDDDERQALFHRIRSFYDTRSKLVHGASLKPKHHAVLAQEPELRDIVRRLLRGFLNLCDSTDFYPDRSFYGELDATLLDSDKRARLFAAMDSGPAAVPARAPESRIASQWIDQPLSTATVEFNVPAEPSEPT